MHVLKRVFGKGSVSGSELAAVGGVTGFLLTAAWAIGIWGNYFDFPSIVKTAQGGRPRNAVSVLVAGVVADEAYGKSNFDLRVKKTLYPDSRIVGSVSENEVKARTSLLFTSATFESSPGLEKGNVSKSEFDWSVEKSAPGSWNIGRMLFKFDNTLELTVKDGVVKGRFVRPWAWDWSISGTCNPEGDVDIKVYCPFSPDLRLVGKVNKS
jgi:hypothetical protein